MNRVVLAENLSFLRQIPDESVDLIYVDPPFGRGYSQVHTPVKTVADERGDRAGFGGKRYRTEKGETRSYEDSFESHEAYYAFLAERFREAYRTLKPTGSFYCHLDYKEAAYVRVKVLDPLFGRERLLSEIVWGYDYGGKTKKKWPEKHDNIWVYTKSEDYVFNVDEVDRIPYMAPGMVNPEKVKLGKRITDCWFHTITPTNGTERTGYPTQKPVGILRRIVAASCPSGGLVLDFFAGSGTTGAAALEKGRKFILVDSNPEAYEVMKRRFSGRDDVTFESTLQSS